MVDKMKDVWIGCLKRKHNYIDCVLNDIVSNVTYCDRVIMIDLIFSFFFVMILYSFGMEIYFQDWVCQ